MKITDKRGGKTFGELEKGDVFIDGAGHICMKTSTLIGEKMEYNAVVLSTGEIDYYEDLFEVTPLNTNLIIED